MFVDATKEFIHPFMPFVAFFTLWSIIEFSEKYLGWLKGIGNLSLFIYLTHPLIFQLLLRVIPSRQLPQLAYGFIIFIFTVIISVIVSWCMQKTIKALPIINKYL